MSSFQSPLLGSLRKPGTEGTSEVTTPSSTREGRDVDALGRERRDTIPSRLGFNPRSTTPLAKTPGSITRGASLTPGGSSSIGTNFKQRLREMQSTQSEHTASPLRVRGNNTSASVLASGGGGGGCAQPASPAPPPRIISALLQGPRREGTPPPCASLEEEMQRLHVESTTNNDFTDGALQTDATKTPEKGLHNEQEHSRNTMASTPSTPEPDTSTHQGTTFEFSSASRPKQQWTPMVNSVSKSSRKAVGAGALSAHRRNANAGEQVSTDATHSSLIVSHNKRTPMESDFRAPPVQQQPLISLSTYKAARGTSYSNSNVGIPRASQGLDNAHSVQRQLRSTLPEFGVAEYIAPGGTRTSTSTSMSENRGAMSAGLKPGTLGDAFQRKKAMAELAVLQKEARQAFSDVETEARCAGVRRETAAALALGDVASHALSASVRISSANDDKGRSLTNQQSAGQQQQQSPGKTVAVAGPPGPPGANGFNGTDATPTPSGLVQARGQGLLQCSYNVDDLVCNKLPIECPASAPFPVTGAFLEFANTPTLVINSKIVASNENVGGVDVYTTQFTGSFMAAFIFCSAMEPTYATEAQDAAGRKRKLKTVAGPPGPPGANGTDATASDVVQVYGQGTVSCVEVSDDLDCNKLPINCPASAPFPVTGAFLEAATVPNFNARSTIVSANDETAGGVNVYANHLIQTNVVAFIFCSTVEPTYATLK